MVIWEELPRDLVSSVVSWLPITDILRSRTISKQFHAWISSISFLDEIARVPTRSSWLVLFPSSTPSIASAYDPSLDSWLSLPVPLQIQPLASSRGLICGAPKPHLGSGSSRSSKELHVCNLVTRSWVRVPQPREMSRFFFLVVGMVSTGRSGFTIVVAGSDLVSHHASANFKLSAWVFESRSWKWTKGGTVLIDAAISTSKAMSGSTLFVVSGNRELAAYDLGRGSWRRVDLPAKELTSVKLVDRLGRLVLVARTNQDEISIWELHQEQHRSREKSLPSDDPSFWIELDRMPRCLSDELLLKSPSRRFACVGSGDVAYFSGTKCASILAYTFSTRSWRWTSCCSSNPHYDMLRGICLEPRLEISPGSSKK
ncbi:F-box only protein 6-like [Selaginella moellendorffii]|uniref:F-box only protein 6-like n=1 Tax=Selaginella moellendorffii TaxID=88036 RepID=UPI000D1C31C2|nr:F-box only protein 6-like [Selaginella moellendorffii]|eukprot:XP_024543000.1 F-box only protein 6-like [Selaginella moellendorffii]